MLSWWGEPRPSYRVVQYGERVQGQVCVLEHAHCGERLLWGHDLFLVAVRPCVKGACEVNALLLADGRHVCFLVGLEQAGQLVLVPLLFGGVR